MKCLKTKNICQVIEQGKKNRIEIASFFVLFAIYSLYCLYSMIELPWLTWVDQFHIVEDYYGKTLSFKSFLTAYGENGLLGYNVLFLLNVIFFKMTIFF